MNRVCGGKGWLLSKRGVTMGRVENVEAIPTDYHVFSSFGVSFPVGKSYLPSGWGHTIILDHVLGCVGNFSLGECWLLHGDPEKEFIKFPSQYVVNSLGNTPPPHTIARHLICLGVGALYRLFSPTPGLDHRFLIAR